MSRKNTFIVEYTNKDIMDKLERIEDKLDGKANVETVYALYGFIATLLLAGLSLTF